MLPFFIFINHNNAHLPSLEQARKVDKKQFLEHFKNDIAACDTNLFGHTAYIEEICDV